LLQLVLALQEQQAARQVYAVQLSPQHPSLP
jgi:hypothetical protein